MTTKHRRKRLRQHNNNSLSTIAERNESTDAVSFDNILQQDDSDVGEDESEDYEAIDTKMRRDHLSLTNYKELFRMGNYSRVGSLEVAVTYALNDKDTASTKRKISELSGEIISDSELKSIKRIKDGSRGSSVLGWKLDDFFSLKHWYNNGSDIEVNPS